MNRLLLFSFIIFLSACVSNHPETPPKRNAIKFTFNGEEKEMMISKSEIFHLNISPAEQYGIVLKAVSIGDQEEWIQLSSLVKEVEGIHTVTAQGVFKKDGKTHQFMNNCPDNPVETIGNISIQQDIINEYLAGIFEVQGCYLADSINFHIKGNFRKVQYTMSDVSDETPR